MDPEQEALLARLESGAGVFEEGLAEAAEILPPMLLASRMDELGGHAGCDLAYLLARREDLRGIAYLARATLIPAQAGRALRYLDSLDMLDLVPPECLTPDYRDRAEAIDMLGVEPQRLEELVRGEHRWPGPERVAEVALYRFKVTGQPVGLLLTRPLRLRVDGGVADLDVDDAMSLACGACFEHRAQRVDLAQIARDRFRAVLKRQAYRHLTEPELVGIWQPGSDAVLVIAAKSNRKPGYLIGGAEGRAPTHWIAAPELIDGSRLTGEQAFGLWYGRMLLAGWR